MKRFYSAVASVRKSKTNMATINRLYKQRIPISVLTAHDFPSALAADKANIDIVLVGDSLAMVAAGYENTTQLTLDEMLYHCKAVKRAVKSSFLVGDLTFGSYEVSPQDAVRSAVRMIQEGGMEAVKLEGGKEMADTIKKITSSGIAVMGHVGLLPQRQASLGGFRVQGKTVEGEANAILDDALALQEAGCFSLVIEAVPAEVGAYITSKLSIPTIGIGAGPSCSGQVLVQFDMLGVFDRFTPKFCKRFDHIGPRIEAAIAVYHKEVKEGTFPTEEHTYPMDPKEAADLAEWKRPR